MLEAPAAIDTQDFEFKLHCKLKIFDANPVETFQNHVNLLCSSSRFGLTFVATHQHFFKVIILKDIIDGIDDNKNETKQFGFRKVAINGKCIQHLALNSDENFLSVIYLDLSSNQSFKLNLYKVNSFLSNNIVTLLTDYELFSSPIRDLAWNPTNPFMFSVCFSDGSLAVYELNQSGGAINSKVHLPSASNSTCMCWSPKGKQIIIGCGINGSITQYKPDLKAVKSYAAPSQLYQNQTTSLNVISILWITNFQFLVVYASHGPEQPHSIVIVNTPKNQPIQYINYKDICYNSGNQRPPQYFSSLQNMWSTIILSSSNSIELSVLASNEDLSAPWQQWMLADTARAELPLSATYQETFPVGFSFDTSSVHQLTWGENHKLAPMPTFCLLSNEGVLCIYDVINLTKLNSICKAPELSGQDLSGLSHFKIQNDDEPQVVAPQQTQLPSPHLTSNENNISEQLNVVNKVLSSNETTTTMMKEEERMRKVKEEREKKEKVNKQMTDEMLQKVLILKELQRFNKKFQLFKQDVNNLDTFVGSEQDKSDLVNKTIVLNKFLQDVQDTTRTQQNEIHLLKQMLLEGFALHSDAVTRLNQLNNPQLSCQLLKVNHLDPFNGKKLAEMQSLIFYIELQLTQINTLLDDEWHEFQESYRKRNVANYQQPTLEMIYKLIININDIIRRQNYVINDIKARVLNRVKNKPLLTKLLKNDPDLSKLSTNFTDNLNVTKSGLNHLLENRINRIRQQLSRFDQHKEEQLRVILISQPVIKIHPNKLKPTSSASTLKQSYYEDISPPSVSPPPHTEESILPQQSIMSFKSIVQTPQTINFNTSMFDSNPPPLTTKIPLESSINVLQKQQATISPPQKTSTTKDEQYNTISPEKSHQDNIAVINLNEGTTAKEDDVKVFATKENCTTSKPATQNNEIVRNLFGTTNPAEVAKPFTFSLSQQNASFITKPETGQTTNVFNFSTSAFTVPTNQNTKTVQTKPSPPILQVVATSSTTTTTQQYTTTTTTVPFSFSLPKLDVQNKTESIQPEVTKHSFNFVIPSVPQKSNEQIKIESNTGYDDESKTIINTTTTAFSFKQPKEITSSETRESQTNEDTQSKITETTQNKLDQESSPPAAPNISTVSTTSLFKPPDSNIFSSSAKLFSFTSPTVNKTSEGPTTTSSAFTTTVAATTTSSFVTTTSTKSIFATPTSTPIVFGTPDTTTTTLVFQNKPSTIFGGSPTQSSIFGTPVQQEPTKLGASTPIFATPVKTSENSVFGSVTTQHSVFASKTSGNIFGGSSASTFQTNTPVFGSQNTFNQAPTFGSTFNQNAPVFGQTSIFGQNTQANNQASLFASTISTASSMFGQTNEPKPVFGQSAFGNTTNLFGQTNFFGSSTTTTDAPTNVFGSSTTTTTSNIFGGATTNVFGSPFAKTSAAASSIFGGGQTSQTQSDSSKSIFGAKPTFGSAFGSSNLFPNTSSTSTFGSSSMFGGASPSSSGGGLFSSGQGQGGVGQTGFSSNAQTTFGGFTTPQKMGASGFGAPAVFGGSPTFGAPPTFGGSPSFGSLSPQASQFGGTQQQNSTFANLANQPIGFASLAQNSPATPPTQSFTPTGSSFSTWRQ